MPATALQSELGNRATGTLLRSLGSPVAPRSAAARVLGARAPEVRVLEQQPIPERPDALAKAEGNRIVLAPGAPGVDTPEGDFLLAHEAAHLRQQHGSGRRVGSDEAEAAADLVAAQAVIGRAPELDLTADGPHYFEARWHQATLSNAMSSAGFTDAEQQEAYFTNWCRDFSQAFTPTVAGAIGVNGAMSLLQALSQMKFGRPVPPNLIGSYEARAHIDNPLGQINADFVQGNADFDQTITGNQSRIHTRYGDIDAQVENYDPARRDEQGRRVGPSGIAERFALNNEAMPQYMSDSRTYIHEQLDRALAAGRTSEGLHAVGNFSHTLEDLFAHSNWVEIAVASVIDREVRIPPAPAEDQSTAAGRVARQLRERRAAQQPLIETFAGEVRDSAGAVRPILQTGTFSGGEQGHDTFISIKHELNNLFTENNPFQGAGGGHARLDEIAGYVLDGIDHAGRDGMIGQIVNDALVERLRGVRHDADAFVNRSERQVLNATLPFLGVQVADIPGATTVADAVTGVAHQGIGVAAAGGRGAINELVSGVRSRTAHLGLRDGYEFLKGSKKAIGHAIDDTKRAISEQLPEQVARPICEAIDAAVDGIKEAVRTRLEAAWTSATQEILRRLDSTGRVDVAQSDMASKRENLTDVQIPRLRDQVAAAIRSVAPGEQGEQAAARLLSLPLDQVIAYLDSPGFRSLLHDLSRTDEGALRQLREDITRVQQIDDVPPWAQAGASHSQIAKDHASSPFFPLAAALAHRADSTVMGLLRDAWAAGGRAAPAPGLESNFDAPPGGGPAPGVSEADAERRRKFLDTRAMGAATLALGQAEELVPGRALRRIAERLEHLLHERNESDERRHRHPPAGGDPVANALRPLIEACRVPERPERLRQVVVSTRTALDAVHDGWTTAVRLDRSLDDVLRVVGQMTDACRAEETGPEHAGHVGMHTEGETAEQHEAHAGRCEPGESTEQHQAHQGDLCAPGESAEQHAEHDPARTEVYQQRQLTTLRGLRGAGGQRAEIDGQFMTAGQVAERERSIAGTADARQRLHLEIDHLFGHPYDSTWWRPTVIEWCNSHMDLLIRYIDERNRGVAHHHH